jgi:ribonuclease HI
LFAADDPIGKPLIPRRTDMSNPLVNVHIDGAARGNPGPAAFAYVMRQDGQLLAEDAGCLGKLTNNVAEYTALVRALQRAAELGARRLLIHSDSELLVKQMNGQYKVKNPDLQVLFQEAKDLQRQFDLVTIKHVAREFNSDADRLCNEALDGIFVPKARPAPVRAVKPPADAVREEALACLRQAARAWAKGKPDVPSPEAVWDELCQMLQKHGKLRSS